MTVSVPETTGPVPIGGNAGTPQPNGLTADQSSAQGQLNAFMAGIGLGSLGTWAWTKYLQGDSIDQIMLDLQATPEYKARFPAMAQLQSEGRGISEAAYIDYENRIKGLHQQYGLPPGLYDTPDQIARGLVNHVSFEEASFRAQQAAAAAYTAPESVKQSFAARLGVANTQSALMAAYLDDTRAIPLLEQQYAAAQVQGAAIDQGLQVAGQRADELAARGVTYAQALQGFGQVQQTEALGQGFGETADQEARTGAAFGEAKGTRTTTRVIKGRLAQFAGGGGAVEAQQGVSGLGQSAQ